MKKFLAILLIAIIACSTVSAVEEFNKAEDGEVVLKSFWSGFKTFFNKIKGVAKSVCEFIDRIFGTNLAGYVDAADGLINSI